MPSPLSSFLERASAQTQAQQTDSLGKQSCLKSPKSNPSVMESGGRVSKAAAQHLQSHSKPKDEQKAVSLNDASSQSSSTAGTAGSSKAKTLQSYFQNFRVDSNISPDDNFI